MIMIFTVYQNELICGYVQELKKYENLVLTHIYFHPTPPATPVIFPM